MLLLSSASTASVAATPEDCATVRAAHDRFLESSFEVERSFRMSVNGDLKKREVARLTFADGRLETEVLEEEVLSKNMVFEGDGDFALDFDFACERLRRTEDGRFELTSEDGLEVLEWRLDEEASALVPLAWRLDTTERFLFKKFVMEGRAEYVDFAWR